MKPRFTPALCNFLEGNGWDIKISIVEDNTLDDKKHLVITILGLPESDLQSIKEEMLSESVLRCTNG